MAKAKKEKQDEPLEKILWQAADKLRKNIGAAEYKHIVLGLIFLKYISDAFEERYQQLAKEDHADPEDIDEYRMVNAFYVPKEARWDFLLSKSKQPTIGKIVDAAMDAIEANHIQLKGILPKVYARPNLDHAALGGLIDKFSNLALGTSAGRSKDLLGHVYEYFLGQFALAEGQKGGKFYTPGHVVRLLVEMLQPYKGQVFDPCCGSGGMFVHSEKFVLRHQGKIDDISIFGQESDLTTWRLAKMNLAIRGIDSSNVKWNNQGSFLKDEFRDSKFDFIIANPPFNDSDWSGNLLQKDGRWQYGIPPVANANFAWIQHFIYHLKPTGTAGFVMPDTSLSSLLSSEETIRKKIVQSGLIDCIVALPSHLFTNTSIAACLWFVSRNKRSKSNNQEVLFIDASKMGIMQKRKNRVLQDDEIKIISETYHIWQNKNETYKNIQGFCRSVEKADIENNNFVLSPTRYVSPVIQQISFKTDFESESFQTAFQKQALSINKQVNKVVNLLNKNEIIDLKDAFNLKSQSQNLLESSELLFKGLLKKYFLDRQVDTRMEKTAKLTHLFWCKLTH